MESNRDVKKRVLTSCVHEFKRKKSAPRTEKRKSPIKPFWIFSAAGVAGRWAFLREWFFEKRLAKEIPDHCYRWKKRGNRDGQRNFAVIKHQSNFFRNSFLWLEIEIHSVCFFQWDEFTFFELRPFYCSRPRPIPRLKTCSYRLLRSARHPFLSLRLIRVR